MGLALPATMPSVLCSRAPPAPERPHVLYSSDQIDYGAPTIGGRFPPITGVIGQAQVRPAAVARACDRSVVDCGVDEYERWRWEAAELARPCEGRWSGSRQPGTSGGGDDDVKLGSGVHAVRLLIVGSNIE
jgi:hypothetical protein